MLAENKITAILLNHSFYRGQTSKLFLITLDLSYMQSKNSRRWRITFLSTESVLAQLTEYLSCIFSQSEQNKQRLQLQQTVPFENIGVNTTG